MDTDNDGIADEEDDFPLDADNDSDGDGVSGHTDNCQNVANPTQVDSDSDGIGNACDNTPQPVTPPSDNTAQIETQIQSLSTGLCIEVPGSSAADGSNVDSGVCTDNAANQTLLFFPLENSTDTYTIEFEHSGLCLTVPDGSPLDGASLIQSSCTASSEQQFRLVDEITKFALFTGTGSGDKVVDSHANTDDIIQWEDFGNENQRWLLLQHSTDDTPADPITTPVDPSVGFQSTGTGTWSQPITLPSIPVSAANLPDGRILTWAAYNRSTYQPYGSDFGQTYTTIFNPETGQAEETLVRNTTHDMFCPGANLLADGRVLVNGGNSSASTSLFNPATATWATDAAMNIPRAYNANTMLSDGRILTLGGSWAEESGCRTPAQNCPDKTAEVWSADSGWSVLDGIPAGVMRTDDKDGLFRSDNHMWLFTMAGGNVLQAGPSKDMHLLDVSDSGSITPVGARADDDDAMNGNAVLYDVGKILTTGGAPDYEQADATRNAFVVEFNNNAVSTRRVESMTYPRAYHNSVVLPNGEVIVIGGQAYPIPFSDQESALVAELWNPVTETFRPLAAMQIPRNYHSVALLLSDGRILAGGGGLCGDCATNHPDVEIFTPPYLLDENNQPRTRPTITSAPFNATHGSSVTIGTTGDIADVVLIRASVVTHSVNNAQRRIPLGFEVGASGNITAVIPSDAGIVIPGNYMLFVLDQAGTPSESRIINIQ